MPSLTRGRDDDRAGRGDRDDRRVEDLGRGLGAVRPAPAHDAADEVQRAAAGADPDDGGFDLKDVAGAHRGAELDVAVRREQPLVAVGTDADLGGDVAEGGERVRPVDEVAGIVGVAVGHVAAMGDDETQPGVGAHAAALGDFCSP